MPMALPSGSYATASVDSGARESIDKVEAKIQAIELLLSDLEHAFWGDSKMRNNGVRLKVRNLSARTRHIIARMDETDSKHRHYLDKTRRESCHGLIDLTKHLKEHKEMSAAEFAVAYALIQKKEKRTDRIIIVVVGIFSALATIATIFKL